MAMFPITETSSNQLSLEKAFERFLRIDVGNGDASDDTFRAYRLHARQWLEWCNESGVNPNEVRPDHIKEYRRCLVDKPYAPKTIALKLTTIRQFYAAMIQEGLRSDNPVVAIKAPRDHRSASDIRHLSENDLALFFAEIGRSGSLSDLRDLCMASLMALHGLRGIEIQRADVNDIQDAGEQTVIVVRGKGHDRLVYLRCDVAQVLIDYQVRANIRDGALFQSVDHANKGHRLTVRGVRQRIDRYLKLADLKRSGLSSHALRHTAATLAYHYTHNLRAVQDMLGHADPKTTARYAQLVDRAESNPANAVPFELG